MMSCNERQQWLWRMWIILMGLIRISSGQTDSSNSGGCRFPEEWVGTWFQKGVPDPIRITSNGDISEKGSCKEISGDKFLIENRHERCLRCMVINQKHSNVLQYKESKCLISIPSDNHHDDYWPFDPFIWSSYYYSLDLVGVLRSHPILISFLPVFPSLNWFLCLLWPSA